MRIWQITLLALEGLWRRPLRVSLTTLGVVIASGALISMVAFGLGVQSHAEDSLKQLDVLSLIKVRPTEEGDSLNDDAVEQLAKLPGVVSAYPNMVAAGIQVVHKERSREGVAVAVPREVSTFGLLDEFLVAGEAFTSAGMHQAILGKRLAEDLELGTPEEAVGSVVTLKASGLIPTDDSTLKFEQEEMSVTIVGIYQLPDIAPKFLVPRGILLPMELMKDLPGVQVASRFTEISEGRSLKEAGYEEVWVRMRKASLVPEAEERIKELGFDTSSSLVRLEALRTFFVFIDVLLAAIGTVGLIVAGLGIVNTLLMSVLERYQEIGVCKAIGASDGDIRLLFLIEAALVGLLGGIGGVVLGRTVAWLLGLAIAAYIRNQDIARQINLFEFPWWLLVVTVLFAVVASILAGVYPAHRAARVDPVRALRGE